MAKTSPEELLTAIADDFHTYLRKGVRFDRVIGSAHPNLAIDDIETLLRIHFVLTEQGDDPNDVGVVDFVRDLEDRIRRMKTTTTRESIVRRGEVRGHIDWQQTVKTRSRAGRLEEPIFVSNQPEEHYDIDENLVLKQLLSVIEEIVFGELEDALQNPVGYEWLAPWTTPPSAGYETAESTAKMFKRVFERNIYLQRIDAERTEVTNRMIEDVKRSRSPFYREAAILLDQYRQLMRQELDSEQARELLNNTIIAPNQPEVLFELYWLFRILNAYEGVEYRLLRDQRDNPAVIAEWEENDARYVMSHDATGTAITFNESTEAVEVESDGYLFRMNEVLSRWQELSATIFDKGTSDSLWGGRPDIVLERFEEVGEGNWELDSVFVGEVKYTQNVEYAATGLRELLEYMAFARRADTKKSYVESQGSVLDSIKVHGLLFVDGLGVEPAGSDPISIVQYPDSVDQVL